MKVTDDNKQQRQDLISLLTTYESGMMNEEEEINFFQHLLDIRLVFKLQGHYQRVAKDLLRQGLITFRKEINNG